MLVLCQRFESKAEQKAPQKTLRNEQNKRSTLSPPEDSQIKSDGKEITFLEFSDDEDEGSLYHLEEKEVSFCCY